MDRDPFDRVLVALQDDLGTWLDKQNAGSDSVCLVTWKAAHPDRDVSRDAVLDALIAYGSIDIRRLKLDDARMMQLISPRRQQARAKTYFAQISRNPRTCRKQRRFRDATG